MQFVQQDNCRANSRYEWKRKPRASKLGPVVKEEISKRLHSPEIEGMSNLRCQLEKNPVVLVSEQPNVERHMHVKTVKLSENLAEESYTSQTSSNPPIAAKKPWGYVAGVVSCRDGRGGVLVCKGLCQKQRPEPLKQQNTVPPCRR